MSVTLRQRAIEKGKKKSYYLDIYADGQRRYESLHIFAYTKPANEAEKIHNQQMKLLAEKRRSQKEQQLLSVRHGIETSFQADSDFLAYMKHYLTEFGKQNEGTYLAMQKNFTEFWQKPVCKPYELTERVIDRFHQYLLDNTQGETSYNYFSRFKRVVKQATKDGLFLKNPAADVQNKKRPTKEKDILTLDEIKQLATAGMRNQDIKRAFLFCCYTGIRFVDAKALDWQNIKEGYMHIKQSKTDVYLSVSLTQTALTYLGERKEKGKVFPNLPTVNSCCCALKVWARKAGVQKHVTFHVARHSFGTNLYLKGVDTRTIAGLLGHAGLKMVMKYTRIGDKIKEDALKLLEE